MSTLSRLSVIGLAAFLGACTIEDTERPDLTGPSGFALRITLQAIPDSILQDGASQAVINIEATGVDGRPVRGLVLRVDQVVDGQLFDFGTVSAKTVVTGDDGRARVIFTAPPRDASGFPHIVQIFVTPVSNDFGGETPRSVNIQLVPVGIILPPNAVPVARFTASDNAPEVFETVSFDASGSTDGTDANGNGIRCGTACTYEWDFGDGSTATGIFATHAYRSPGNYQVRLTVTDARGASNTVAATISVASAGPPTGAFTFSPAEPGVGQPVFFNASTVRAATGRQIVSYSWNFGDGTTGTGVTTSHSYSAPGTYRVTLTVVDDAGTRTTIGPQEVEVGTTEAGLGASLIVTPNPGTTNDTFVFDASASGGTSRIVSYRFIFGDGTPDDTRTTPVTTHRYTTPGTYIAEVVVTDSTGRTARQTQTVRVNAP